MFALSRSQIPALSPIRFAAFLIFSALLVSVKPLFGAPSFLDVNSKSNNGVVTLKWEGPAEGAEYELEQSSHADFSPSMLRYRGSDKITIFSGLAAGAHYFRVREAGGEWSQPVKVEVGYIAKGKLIGLLLVGLIVVALTVGAIVTGYKKEVEGGAE